MVSSSTQANPSKSVSTNLLSKIIATSSSTTLGQRYDLRATTIKICEPLVFTLLICEPLQSILFLLRS
ncbi:hypothetical protein IEQ34_004792 [Dendrobium chrysotoxum]|uniref:Uncharacterized protein n=1 Tax=Dendrobium chrysotoxum TaxID=161865 RepID=A0AAV7HAI2_DENCH|nr:hypothetical protein IEQ34_004792 [Dendrobium chrysotoxum]